MERELSYRLSQQSARNKVIADLEGFIKMEAGAVRFVSDGLCVMW